jgi:hypothetical protein
MELCTSYLKELSVMGVKIRFFMRVEMKKSKPLWSLEKRQCCGIKYWDILERRDFDHYMVKVWLKVCLIANWILIFVNITYMVNRIG